MFDADEEVEDSYNPDITDPHLSNASSTNVKHEIQALNTIADKELR